MFRQRTMISLFNKLKVEDSYKYCHKCFNLADTIKWNIISSTQLYVAFKRDGLLVLEASNVWILALEGEIKMGFYKQR